MNMTETAKLLTVASMIDNRKVEDETVIAWHRAIGHLGFEAAQAAVLTHFGESTEYLLPGHVSDIVRRMRTMAERESRRRPAAVDQQVVTLDREAFDDETARWTDYYRKQRAQGVAS